MVHCKQQGLWVLIPTLALLAASGLCAQDLPNQSGGGNNGDLTATPYAEVMRAQRVLTSLLSESLRLDPGLNKLREQFELTQREAMISLDPATTGRMQRMAELQTLYTDISATQQRPDVGALLNEGRQIQRQLQATAAEARKQPQVAAQATVFANALETRFRQIDPESFEMFSQHKGWIEAVWAALLVEP